MKPYPHKCPKCGCVAVVPKTVAYTPEFGKAIDDLPVLECFNCGQQQFTNDTDDRLNPRDNSDLPPSGE